MDELALHLLDLLENSLAAGALHIRITISEDTGSDQLTIEVEDDGRGMEEKDLKKVLDPFYTTRTSRRVGLGLSLLQATARQCEGFLALDSEPGRGTRVTATMRLGHLDRPPLGNMGATIAAALGRDDTVDITYSHSRDKREFAFSSAWLRKELEGLPLNNGRVLDWVQRYINGELSKMFGGEGW